MDWRRSFLSVAILAALAAGAAGAHLAAPSSPSAAAAPMPAGWEISDHDPDSSWVTLTMTHRVGEDRLEFSFDVTAHNEVPARPMYRVESHFEGQNCLVEDFADVGNAAAADRGRLTHALVERGLGAIRQDCFAPGRQAALLEGFDAAYAALAARFQGLRPRMDAAGDAMRADQAEMAASMEGMDMNMTMEETGAAPPPEASKAR